MAVVIILLGTLATLCLMGLLGLWIGGHRVSIPLVQQQRLIPALGGAALAFLVSLVALSTTLALRPPPAPTPAPPPALRAAVTQTLHQVAVGLQTPPSAQEAPGVLAPTAGPGVESAAQPMLPPSDSQAVKSTLEEGLRLVREAQSGAPTEEAKLMRELMASSGLRELPTQVDPGAMASLLGALEAPGPQGDMAVALKELSQGYQAFQRGSKSEADRRRLQGTLQEIQRRGLLKGLPELEALVTRATQEPPGK